MGTGQFEMPEEEDLSITKRGQVKRAWDEAGASRNGGRSKGAWDEAGKSDSILPQASCSLSLRGEMPHFRDEMSCLFDPSEFPVREVAKVLNDHLQLVERVLLINDNVLRSDQFPASAVDHVARTVDSASEVRRLLHPPCHLGWPTHYYFVPNPMTHWPKYHFQHILHACLYTHRC